MKQVSMYLEEIAVQMNTGVDVKDVTEGLNQIARASHVSEGNLTATVIGSTGSITTIEYEPGVVADLIRAINELAPPDREYEHEKAWHDGNGHSHVQAALLGPSISVPIRKGKIQLGTWQQVVMINHDNHPRKRKLSVTVTGHLA